MFFENTQLRFLKSAQRSTHICVPSLGTVEQRVTRVEGSIICRIVRGVELIDLVEDVGRERPVVEDEVADKSVESLVFRHSGMGVIQKSRAESSSFVELGLKGQN